MNQKSNVSANKQHTVYIKGSITKTACFDVLIQLTHQLFFFDRFKAIKVDIILAAREAVEPLS